MPPSAEQLRRLRLAAQRLSPGTEAKTAEEAAAAVCGIQAQDLRAATLALRSRVPGLTRADIEAADLVRLWTVRGTIHLLPTSDLPWMRATVWPRNHAWMERTLEKRGGLDIARGMLPDVLELIAERPRDRAELLRELDSRGHADLGAGPVNLLMPWVALQGLARGSIDGRWHAADPPEAMDEDEALETMARRYLAGYGPATAADLARWSGLPTKSCARGLDAAGPLDSEGDLLGLPGSFDAEPPPPASVQLLAGFDTVMLGYRSREPVLPAEHDKKMLPGGGMLKAVVLSRGRAVATWKLAGSGARRRLEPEWFGRPAAARGLAAEARDVGRFLGFEVALP